MSVSSVAPHSVLPAAMSDPGAGVPSPVCNLYDFTTPFFRCRWEFERKTPVKFLIINREKKDIIIVMKLRETKEGM